MSIHDITLMEAYLIESIRKSGATDREIITNIKAGDISAWQLINEKFDYTILIALANKDETSFESIIKEGYHIKFLTFNGLKNMLSLKFNKQSGKDFKVIEKGVEKLRLSKDELNILRQFMSVNWTIKTSGTNDITIEYV